MKSYLNQLVLRAALLGLAATGSLRAQTTISGTIQSGGLTREYRLYVPAAYRAGTPVPLLFNLHGLGSNNIEQEAYGDFRPIADTANFLIVHPNGAPNAQLGGIRGWNTSSAISSTVDDVAFISALLDDIRARYSVDLNRVYSTGMSNGGFMSYELACKLSARIAAIASVAGSMTPDRLQTPAACIPQHPTPILEIHGTDDNTVNYDGGLAFGVFPTAAIPAVLDYWVKFNACTPTPSVITLPNTSTTDYSTVERSVWSGGRNGSVVVHYKIIGGGHTWPGASLALGFPPQSATKPTNQDISASVEIWRFLRRYRLNKLVLATTPARSMATSFTIAPNPAGPDGNVLIYASQPLQPAQVTLLDALGRRLPTHGSATTSGAMQLDVSALTNGVYVLQIELNGQRSQQKLIR